MSGALFLLFVLLGVAAWGWALVHLLIRPLEAFERAGHNRLLWAVLLLVGALAKPLGSRWRWPTC